MTVLVPSWYMEVLNVQFYRFIRIINLGVLKDDDLYYMPLCRVVLALDGFLQIVP